MSKLHSEARLNDVFKSLSCQGIELWFMCMKFQVITDTQTIYSELLFLREILHSVTAIYINEKIQNI